MSGMSAVRRMVIDDRGDDDNDVDLFDRDHAPDDGDFFADGRPDFGSPQVLECIGFDDGKDVDDDDGRPSVLRPVAEADIVFYQQQIRLALRHALRAAEHAATAYGAAIHSRRMLSARTAEIERLARRAACESYNAHIAAGNVHTAYVWRERGNAERGVRHAADACRLAARASARARIALVGSKPWPEPVAP